MNSPRKKQSKDNKERGSQTDESRFLVIGEITKPHGVQGEVRVKVHTELPERFKWLKTVYLGKFDPQPEAVESVRFHKQMVLLKLEAYQNRNDVEGLRGVWLQVPEAEGIPLEEGQYYYYQVIGLEVATNTGQELGKIDAIIETGANNVFVVKKGKKEILVPDTDEIVVEIDFEAGKMIIEPIPGLLPE